MTAKLPRRAPAACPCWPLLTTLLFAATPTTAAAATPGGRGTAPVLDPVVVTATRDEVIRADVPASIDVVDAADLTLARPALSLAEALPRVPGLVVRDRQNQAQDLQLSIRGFGARATFGVRGVRLYADGIPATMPDGQGQVSHFALEAAQRIEVLRGPFSALYGNASGGVLAVFSAPPPAAAEFEAGALVGSDGQWRLSASWRGPVGGIRDDDTAAGDPRHGLRVDAARAAGDGFRDHSAWRRDTGQAQLRGALGRGRYTLLLNTLDLRADDPQGLTATELALDRRAASPNSLLFDARKTVAQEQLGTRLEWPVGETQAFEAVAWRGRRATWQMLTVPAAAQGAPSHGGGVIDLDRDYHGADARWQWHGDAATLTLGASREVASERRRGFENFDGARLGVVGRLRRDEDNRVTSDDVYAQADWRPGERWRINAGLRHSRVRFASRDHFVAPGNPDDSGGVGYTRATPVLGVLWRADDAWAVYANAGTGFETPTFAELAYRRDGGSGLNIALRPARSVHAEAGLRWRGARADATIALFQARTRDELVVVANQGGRSYFDNAGLSRRRGVEAAFEAELAPAWRFAASYTFLDARHQRDFATCATPPCTGGDTLLIRAGARIPGLARHTGWAELRWSPDARTDVLLEGRATSAIAASDGDPGAFAAGHALFGMGVEHRFGRRDGDGQPVWRLFARIDNLLDRDVVGSVIVNDGNGRFYEPAPGRTWQVGFSAVW
ncbi:TonB-dependent receptor family protein [Arenimonas composti]|uniref:TonB-dependent receptor plug domain-containing protein n=1 Tax=Arenimonas composti TR7-09 = DSM 18010 TaxID=1121013 RepID=A0A091BIH3_9GAMM|nr:TonB-dependent receptor [Arenimonas composti]KFN50584.1 hypothetical protein P873_05335 [Arenimonas composti TR7-09 = DSM 18010]